MKSQEARDFVKTMEVDYNAKNKMINSTVAHQAVRMAEMDLTKKAIEALSSILEDWVHGGDADYIIAEFEERLND